jgi:hypothetical protein
MTQAEGGDWRHLVFQALYEPIPMKACHAVAEGFCGLERCWGPFNDVARRAMSKWLAITAHLLNLTGRERKVSQP